MQPSIADAASRLLRLPSFLIGGFEGADHTNSSGVPVAMLDVTGHAHDHPQNYARLRAIGIRTVRESVGWSRAERDGCFDFSCARRRAEAARRVGVEMALDMLTGRLAPELGGAPRYVDCIGANYYHGNQFEVATDKRLHWHLRDRRRVPFRALLRETFARYRKPLPIAETSHVDVGRGRWIAEIAREIRATLNEGVPVAGLCLYPIVDRHDWERLSLWHHSGLWDRVVAVDGLVSRRLEPDYLAAVRYVQHVVGDARAPNAKQPSTTAMVAPTRADWLLDATGAPFDRVFMHGNVASSSVRSGHFALACEIVHSVSRPLTLHGSALVRRCVDSCVRNGWIASRDDVVTTHENDFPVACVVDDDPASLNRRAIARWLDAHGIAFTGSDGRWEIGRCADVLTGACAAADAARHATGVGCEAQTAS